MRARFRLAATIAVLLALAGCGGPPPPGVPTTPAEMWIAAPGTAARVAEDALGYVGTPYRRGGTDRRGIDCSGLVQRVYLDRGYPLPRTAEDLSRTGAPVTRDALAPGDILVFRTRGQKPTHVGVYVGDGKFVHAPGSGDEVRVSALDEGYFRERFLGGRRVLSE